MVQTVVFVVFVVFVVVVVVVLSLVTYTPLACFRVLIVDWDIHHGNGTQHQFYDDKRYGRPRLEYCVIMFMGGGSFEFFLGRGDFTPPPPPPPSPPHVLYFPLTLSVALEEIQVMCVCVQGLRTLTVTLWFLGC